MICSKLGMNYTHCSPEKYQILPEWSNLFEANNRVSGGVFKQTADIGCSSATTLIMEHGLI